MGFNTRPISLWIIFIFALQIFLIWAKDESKYISASLFQDASKKGPSVTYADNMEFWSNFPKLKNHTKLIPKTLCVTGPWLIYKQPDFRVDNLESVQFFSGDNKCIQPKNMTAIGSIQPIGIYSGIGSSITVFEEENFGSFAQPFAPKGTEVMRFKWSRLPSLGSIITVGKSSWTLLDYNGKSICIKISSQFINPICFLPNTIAVGLEYYKFEGVRAKCDSENGKDNTQDKIVELNNCKEYGQTNIEDIPDIAPKAADEAIHGRTMGNSVKRKRKTTPSSSDCIKIDDSRVLDAQQLNEEMIRKFASLRFNHDFSNPIQMMWPDRQEDIWKTEILDIVFHIAISSIPDEIVPSIYLQTLREFAMFHLDQAWKTRKTNLTVDNKEIESVLDLITSCAEIVDQTSSQIEDMLLTTFMDMSNPVNLNFLLRPDFARNRKLDHVIDTTWMISNYAYSLCHHLLESSTNFWTDYVRVVQDIYFNPLIQQWQTPTITSRSYTAIFGGLGVKTLHKRLAYAVGMVFAETPNLPLFQRAITKT